MALTPAEKMRRQRAKRKQEMQNLKDENDALRVTLMNMEQKTKELEVALRNVTADRVKSNVAEVNAASQKGPINRYSRKDLYAALEIGRWSGVVDMAMADSDVMAAKLVQWWRCPPDPKEEPEDYDVYRLRWLLAEWALDNYPVDWPPFEQDYLR